MSKVFKCKFCNKAYSARRTLNNLNMFSVNTGQVKFSNSMMGIFEDLKTNEVDPEVIVDKIGLMHELPNALLDMYLLTQKNHPKSMMFLKATCSHVKFVEND